jgi:hypothetical protein
LLRDSSSALTIFLTIRSRITHFRPAAKPDADETRLHRDLEISIVRDWPSASSLPISGFLAPEPTKTQRVPKLFR